MFGQDASSHTVCKWLARRIDLSAPTSGVALEPLCPQIPEGFAQRFELRHDLDRDTRGLGAALRTCYLAGGHTT